MRDERGTTAALIHSSFIVHRSALILAALFFASTALGLEIPPAPTQWFTDAAGIVDSTTASALNQKLSSFEQRSGAQFIIYVFRSLEGEALEDFTIRCAERWKVGNKKYDNGLILFVFIQEKKIRLEVGYGLEPTMTDAFSSRVIREYIAPHFKENDYAGGLNAGADAIIARIEQKEAPVPPVGGGASGAASPGGIDIFAVIVILFIFFFFILPMLRRGGGCGGCFWPMFFMGGGRGGGITFGGGGSFGGGGASGGW